MLSSSTAEYDLGEKFTKYKSISSFHEYLVVSQTRPFVIRYFRHPNGFWVRHDYEGVESEVLLESLNVKLRLSEIYERMNWGEALMMLGIEKLEILVRSRPLPVYAKS